MIMIAIAYISSLPAVEENLAPIRTLAKEFKKARVRGLTIFLTQRC